MRIVYDTSTGEIVLHGSRVAAGDAGAGEGFVEFAANEQAGFPTGWRVSGAEGSRRLVTPSGRVAAFEPPPALSPRELPDYEDGDAGDVLTLSEEKLPEWAAPVVNGGSQPLSNWCKIVIASGLTPLTNDQPQYYIPGSALTIEDQAGDDFSIHDPGSGGRLASAAGGVFQASWYASSPTDATLDPSSTELRWLFWGLGLGDPNGFGNFAGIAGTLPILTSGSNAGWAAMNPVSTPGVVAPGGDVLAAIGYVLINSVPGDLCPLEAARDPIYVWQL
jgi:hypothetical protein